MFKEFVILEANYTTPASYSQLGSRRRGRALLVRTGTYWPDAHFVSDRRRTALRRGAVKEAGKGRTSQVNEIKTITDTCRMMWRIRDRKSENNGTFLVFHTSLTSTQIAHIQRQREFDSMISSSSFFILQFFSRLRPKCFEIPVALFPCAQSAVDSIKVACVWCGNDISKHFIATW